MRIGILGGSFDPIHNGHLWLADQAREELGLERVYFVPAYLSPLKEDNALFSRTERVRLLKKALKPFPGFDISLCEMTRKGVSYTIDTVKYFRKKHSKNDMLFFLSGSDVLKDLHRWKDPEGLFRLCRFVVMQRPGHRWQESAYPVLKLVSGAPDVSSTKIRQALQKKKSLRGLVPQEIEREILKSKSVLK